MGSRIRVVIADDEPLILDQIGSYLKTRFEVVAETRNGRELVDAVRRLSPSVVVADVVMPELNGIEATRQIKETDPAVKVVMLSGHEDPELIEAAFEAGAVGYVVKIRAFGELIPAIESVLSGRPYRPLINS